MFEEDAMKIREIRENLRLVKDDELKKEISEVLDMVEVYFLKSSIRTQIAAHQEIGE